MINGEVKMLEIEKTVGPPVLFFGKITGRGLRAPPLDSPLIKAPSTCTGFDRLSFMKMKIFIRLGLLSTREMIKDNQKGTKTLLKVETIV